MTSIGIHDLAVATTHHVLDLAELAEATGVEPAKYHRGLGQEQMSFPVPDEDIVTMGASAAAPLLAEHGTDGIRSLLFATESGVDQSKAAGVFAHHLLGLPSTVRTVEFKQACYGGAAALQTALGIVARNPEERVLVIASDVARYELDGPAAPTQGAGAVAMLVSADPALLAIEPHSGVHTADIDDFWRPNDTTTPLVDGALSLQTYLDALLGSWGDLQAHGGPGVDEIDRFLYHQPFTKMARKAHAALFRHEDRPVDESALETSFLYNRQLGNSYTASLFVGLAALLDHDDDLAGRRLGLFSYGSGSVGEFLTGIVQSGYRERRRREATESVLAARVPLTVEEYRALHVSYTDDSDERETPRTTAAPFRFAGVRDRIRRYERTAGA
ncbi:hydroxymethylglutaryl-CoA synthase [Brachybacterium alimentarium]|uniref:hydroxymethylglutaryl-CoA synthase n=1 Tax=Brachybacterium alimentarium TaxID=47845 RepID=UPI003FD31FFF